ncbi:MAG: hypothetical protein ABW166_20145 [Sedimenticola sp.]
MPDKMPWDYHLDLSEDRLLFIAKLIMDIRHDTLELHDEESGDSPWSFGCRVYDRTRMILVKESTHIEWLTVPDPSLKCIFQIGSVPVRFYRGDADEPTKRTMARSYTELQQCAIAFEGDDKNLLWRFAVEADSSGEVTSITFVGLSESEEVKCHWSAPIFEPVATVTDIASFSGDGVDIGPPVVAPPNVDEDSEIGST